MTTKSKKKKPQEDATLRYLLAVSERNIAELNAAVMLARVREAELRRDIASLENRVATQQSSMAELVFEKQQQAKKISDLNQENATLVAHKQILKSGLSASSSIIRDVLDIS